ncbi:MAG: hypothetical protein POH28_09065 [Acidocella sp.]|nr:hypothetical protein [Acidocella sp.]
MVTETSQSTVLPAAEEFDTHAKQGWAFFTKFLTVNVVVTIVALLVVGLLTVWS